MRSFPVFALLPAAALAGFPYQPLHPLNTRCHGMTSGLYSSFYDALLHSLGMCTAEDEYQWGRMWNVVEAAVASYYSDEEGDPQHIPRPRSQTPMPQQIPPLPLPHTALQPYYHWLVVYKWRAFHCAITVMFQQTFQLRINPYTENVRRQGSALRLKANFTNFSKTANSIIHCTGDEKQVLFRSRHFYTRYCFIW
jgi:hypothetical protein